jgi:hypothetical protein
MRIFRLAPFFPDRRRPGNHGSPGAIHSRLALSVPNSLFNRSRGTRLYIAVLCSHLQRASSLSLASEEMLDL